MARIKGLGRPSHSRDKTGFLETRVGGRRRLDSGPPRKTLMTSQNVRWKLSVPGSTSNLGPGFDFAGLALSVVLEVEVEVLAHAREHEFGARTGTASEWPTTSDNLLLRAFDLGIAELGLPPTFLRVSAHSDIPIARGLGSSGAAIAAGAMLAAALSPTPVPLERVCAWGMAIEGHPDNTTASIAGGCTLAIPRGDGTLRVVRQPLHGSLGFAVAYPHTKLATKAARAVLPKMVSFEDAVENPRRLAALLEGLRTGDAELLRLGGEDRLHARYRLAMIPGGEAALAVARDRGAWMATVSGSGSALFAIGPKGVVEDVAAGMRGELGRGSEGGAEGKVVTVVEGPVRVVRVTGRG